MGGVGPLSSSAHAQYTEQSGAENPFDGITALSTPAALDAITGDFDTDGDADLLAYDGSAARYYENDGTGTFAEQTGSNNPFDGLSAAFGTRGRTFVRDVEADGDLDLVTFTHTGGGTGTLAFFENTDGSTYVQQTGGDNPFGGLSVSGNQATVDAVMGDFSGTAAPDLLIYDGTAERYFENDGTGTFSEMTGSDNPFAGLSTAFWTKATTLVRDFDGDGDVDLAFRDGTGTATGWRYRENTGSAFAARTGSDNPLSNVAADATSKSVAVATGDFDLDDHLDLLTYDSGTQRYYDGNGSGTFTEQTSGANPFDSVDPALQTKATTVVADPSLDRDPDLTFADAGALRYIEQTRVLIVVNDNGSDPVESCGTSPDAPTPSDGFNQAAPADRVLICPGGYSEATLEVTTEATLATGADVTISDELTLTSGTFDVSRGSLTLTSTGESSSARIAGSGSGTISGDVTIERHVERKDGGAETSHWRLMASPLGGALDEETSGSKGEHDTYSGPPLLSNTWTQGANMEGANFQGSSADPSVFFYDETADVGTDPQRGWSSVGDLVVPTTGSQVENQEGFAVFLFQDRDFDGTDEGFPLTLSVTGTVQGDENSGINASLPVSCTNNDGTGADGCTDPNDGWNLVANPYVSHIDWTSGSFSRTALEANAYVYDADNGHYDQTDGTNEGDSFIAPFQAFFVKSNATDGNEGSVDLKVNSGAKADPSTSGDREFKSEAKRPLVSLQLSDGTRAEETRLTFRKGADSGKDRYDGYQLTPLSGDYHLLASQIEGRAGTYDSQYRPLPSEDSLTVGLTVTTTSGGTYEIEADTLAGLPGDLRVAVVDTKTGERADLQAGESLSFEVDGSSTAKAKKHSPRELLAEGPVQKATSTGVIEDRFELQVVPASAIPVELAGFEAEADEQAAVLTWQTASETNSAGFAVERKTGSAGPPGGSGGWTEVGFVESKARGGTTTEAQTYRFTDTEVPFEAEGLRYRLRQEDLDGTTSLSKEVTVELGAPSKATLHAPFPNPASRRATLRYETPAATDLKIGLYDVLGRRIRTVVDRSVQAGRHEARVSARGLSAGTYFLRMRAGGPTKTRRLTVIR